MGKMRRINKGGKMEKAEKDYYKGGGGFEG